MTSDATTVGDVLADITARFGSTMADVVRSSGVWCNGQPAELSDRVDGGDEIAVLPPVSGG